MTTGLVKSVGVTGLLLMVTGATGTAVCGPCGPKTLEIELTETVIDDTGGTVTVYARGTKVDTPATGYTLDAVVERKDGQGFWRYVDTGVWAWQDEWVGPGEPECSDLWNIEVALPDTDISPGDLIRVHVSVTGYVPMSGTEFYSPEVTY